MPYSRYTEEDIKEMRRLRGSGLSSVKVGKKFKCDHATVLYLTGSLKKSPKIRRMPLDSKPHYIPILHRPAPIPEIWNPPPPVQTYIGTLKKQMKLRLIRNKRGEVIGREEFEVNDDEIHGKIKRSGGWFASGWGGERE